MWSDEAAAEVERLRGLGGGSDEKTGIARRRHTMLWELFCGTGG